VKDEGRVVWVLFRLEGNVNRNKKILIIFIVAFFIIIQTPILSIANSWSYGQSKDEMSGAISKYATKKSGNTVDFSFPYHGEQHATIMVFADTVLFYLQKGQIICDGSLGFHKCLMRIKFDDKKDKYVKTKILGHDSTTIKFTEPGFLNELKKSKKFMIQVEVFKNGFPTFTFDLRGLNPSLIPTK